MLDMWNNKIREVVCIRTDQILGDGDYPSCLELGEIYTFVGVNFCHTLVKLREFPGMYFNDNLFDEINESE